MESLISNKAANKKTMKKEMETPHFVELDNFYQVLEGRITANVSETSILPNSILQKCT